MRNRRDGADQGIPRYHESIKQAELDGQRLMLLEERLEKQSPEE